MTFEQATEMIANQEEIINLLQEMTNTINTTGTAITIDYPILLTEVQKFSNFQIYLVTILFLVAIFVIFNVTSIRERRKK